MTFHKHNIFQLRSCHPVHIVDQLHRHACIYYVDAACTRSLRANGNQRRTGCAIAICNERNTFLSTEQVPTERYGCHLIGRDGRRLEFVRRSAQNTRRHFLQSRALSAAWVSTLPQISVFTPKSFCRPNLRHVQSLRRVSRPRGRTGDRASRHYGYVFRATRVCST